MQHEIGDLKVKGRSLGVVNFYSRQGSGVAFQQRFRLIKVVVIQV